MDLHCNSKMNYKRVEGKKVNTMKMKKLGIMEVMREHIHFKNKFYGENVKKDSKHKCGDPMSIAGTCMFRIDVRPPEGIMIHEIEKLKKFVIDALGDWIDYYAIGLEGSVENGTAHMHISIVLNTMLATAGIKKLFYPLLDPSRIDPTGNLNFDVAMKIQPCPMNQAKYKTPMAQMAYVLKGAAEGKTFENIEPSDYNDGQTYWTNLFDDECHDTAESKEQWRLHRIRFAQMLVDTDIKHKHKAPYIISSDNMNDMAIKYAIEHGLQWSEEAHASILATMVTDTDGEKQYKIGPSFGWNKKVRRSLNRKNKRPDFKNLLAAALQAQLDSDNDGALAKAAGGVSTQQAKKLARDIEKLKLKNTELKNICKAHVVTIQNYKRNQKRKERGLSPLQDQTKTAKFMINTAPEVGDLCCVCGKDTAIESGFQGRHIRIDPCNHKYCQACIETQLDKNTIPCSHCNINAIEGGIRLKEEWCPQFKNEMEFHRGIEYARQTDAHAAKRQKKRNYDDVVVTGSTLATKEEKRRAKRLKAIDSRKLKN